MELMIGGDFAGILEDLCALDESVARFYIAEVILAIDSIHHLGIIHRDLKPENLLLGKDGHIKLVDFGLSEVGVAESKIRT
jgi:serine/threonine protein kinase